MRTCPTCRECDTELNDDNWYHSFKKRNRCMCKDCAYAAVVEWRNNNKDKVRYYSIQRLRKNGHVSMDENTLCSLFLGVHIAERILSKIFEDVERMPHGNPGYDLICKSGKLIDVKSACSRISKSGTIQWGFSICKNIIPDYFVLLAFDNRTNFTPCHAWLIPGHVLNCKTGVTISITRIDKWNEYRLDIDKVITCCNAMKEGDI